MPLSKPLKIGVTGGIGSGKTVICQIFQSFGIPVYNADHRAKQVMRNNEKVRSAISKIFGREAYHANGELNSNFLSEQVFDNETRLAQLNGIVHPAVAEDFADWVDGHLDKPYIIKEAALLVESGSYKSLDLLINVRAPVDLRISRVLSRDPHRSRQEVLNIMSNQLNEKYVTEKSSFVIDNDGRTLVIPEVLRIHQHLIS